MSFDEWSGWLTMVVAVLLLMYGLHGDVPTSTVVDKVITPPPVAAKVIASPVNLAPEAE